MEVRKWKHRYPQKAFPRAERKLHVIRQFCAWHDNKDTEPKTMNRIARALGMQPAQTVTDILLELVAEGQLKFEERDQKGKWTTRFYSLSQPRDHYHEKSLRRKITVQKRGVAVGQLEMFS